MTTTSASTRVEQLAEFVTRADFDQLSEEAREQLKLRVLDSLGCALGALEGDPVKMIAEQNREFGGGPPSAQIGAGRTAPDRAALYNGAGPLPAVVEVLSASASA
jgi:2-methylcitrate dehydratase